MKKTELGKKFNPVIAELMEEGFILSPTELRGGYGLFGQQICLAKGLERVVLWMEKDSRKEEDEKWSYIDEVHVYAARFTIEDERDIELKFGWPKNWAEHLFMDEVFYEVERDEWYIDNLEEYKRIRVLQAKRSSSRGYRWQKSSETFKMNDKLLSICRKFEGFKKVRPDMLEVTREITWRGTREYVIRNHKSGRVKRLYLG